MEKSTWIIRSIGWYCIWIRLLANDNFTLKNGYNAIILFNWPITLYNSGFSHRIDHKWRKQTQKLPKVSAKANWKERKRTDTITPLKYEQTHTVYVYFGPQFNWYAQHLCNFSREFSIHYNIGVRRIHFSMHIHFVIVFPFSFFSTFRLLGWLYYNHWRITLYVPKSILSGKSPHNSPTANNEQFQHQPNVLFWFLEYCACFVWPCIQPKMPKFTCVWLSSFVFLSVHGLIAKMWLWTRCMLCVFASEMARQKKKKE